MVWCFTALLLSDHERAPRGAQGQQGEVLNRDPSAVNPRFRLSEGLRALKRLSKVSKECVGRAKVISVLRMKFVPPSVPVV